MSARRSSRGRDPGEIPGSTDLPRRCSHDEEPRSPGGGAPRDDPFPVSARRPAPGAERACPAGRLGTIPSRCPNATPWGGDSSENARSSHRSPAPPLPRGGDTRRRGAGPQGASGRSVPGAHAPLSRGGGDLCACARRPTDRPPAAPAGRIHETRAGARTAGRSPPAPSRRPPTGRRENAGAETASTTIPRRAPAPRLRSRDRAPESRVSGSRSARRPASPTPAPRPYRR